MRTSSQLAEDAIYAHALGAWLDREAIKQFSTQLSKRTIKDILETIMQENGIKSCRPNGQCNNVQDGMYCDYHSGWNGAIQDLYSSISKIEKRERQGA